MSEVERITSLPVQRYLSALESGLRGHARDKSRLLLELQDGLEDAATAHTVGGLSPQQAGEQALDGFGSVEELVRACQPELLMRQVRRTARAVTVTVPAVIAFWQLLLGARANLLPRGAVLIGEHVAGLGAATAVLGALTLLLTGTLSRWLPIPRRLPMLVAATGIVSAATMAAAPLAVAAAAPEAAAMWPSVLFAAAVAAVPITAVAMSAWLCRSCAVS